MRNDYHVRMAAPKQHILTAKASGPLSPGESSTRLRETGMGLAPDKFEMSGHEVVLFGTSALHRDAA